MDIPLSSTVGSELVAFESVEGALADFWGMTGDDGSRGLDGEFLV